LNQGKKKSKEQAKKRVRKGLTGIFAAIALLVLALLMVLALGPELEKRTYKLQYPEEIAQYSEQYKLDPYLVAAVIHCESANRADAVSGAGAMGLMQLMPDTGEWIAGKLSIKNYEDDLLLQPETSIRMGCWYLRFLLDRYGGDQSAALAAYNAGHGNVDKWINDPAVSQDGRLVNIPYAETKQYVEKVHRAYEKYKALYQDAF